MKYFKENYITSKIDCSNNSKFNNMVEFGNNNIEYLHSNIEHNTQPDMLDYTLLPSNNVLNNTNKNDLNDDLDELEIFNTNNGLSPNSYTPASQLVDNGINGNNNKIPSINLFNKNKNITTTLQNNIENRQNNNLKETFVSGDFKKAFKSDRLDKDGPNSFDWRTAQIPAANGHGTAQSLAKEFGPSLSRRSDLKAFLKSPETNVSFKLFNSLFKNIFGINLIKPN
jgi:hypothetical protein